MKHLHFPILSLTLVLATLTTAAMAEDTNINIDATKFKPVEMVMPAMSTPQQTTLSTTQPTGITKIPTFKGSQQYYGTLNLGDPVADYYFALDLQTKDSKQFFVMYFDQNHDGDLTNDGSAHQNQGSGSGAPGDFATKLPVNWNTLIAAKTFGNTSFNIWFFSNQGGWPTLQVSHYSRTQLKGKVKLDKKHKYKAYLVDSGYNDANLTNDGVILDLNNNGVYDPGEGPFQSYTANGKTYNFQISW